MFWFVSHFDDFFDEGNPSGYSIRINWVPIPITADGELWPKENQAISVSKIETQQAA